MRVAIAYVFIVLLWATTPLAIKWSAAGADFLVAATTRMSIGLGGLLLILVLKRQALPWRRAALATYLAVTVQLYGSMLPVYWAAQFIPSGWVSVIFGLSPLITAIMAAIWLRERSLNFSKLCAYLLGLTGLAVMFVSAVPLGRNAVLSIATIVFSAILQCFSAVWLKRINAGLPALTQITGGLLLSVPLYWLTWYCSGAHWPAVISDKAWLSIIYLGVVATTIGFGVYYYLLNNLTATQVALITFITPVFALYLGHVVNHEPLTLKSVLGSLSILAALLLHGFSELRGKARPPKPVPH